MKATPEELEEFNQELKNLTGETNPVLFPFMFAEMMEAFDSAMTIKEFISTIKEKYSYKDLHELVDKTESKDTFDFYKEVYNLGMKNGVNTAFPRVSAMIENSKKLADDLEKLDKKNKQMIEKVCEWLFKNFYHEETMVDCIAYKHEDEDINVMVEQFKKFMEE